MAVLYRICLTEVEQHSTALFSNKRLELKWSNRLSELLRVPVCTDNLPEHICCMCKSRVENTEKKLPLFRQQARDTCSYEKLSSTRKHTNSTLDVSPATAQARPPAKRTYTALQRRKLFPSEKEESLGEY